MNLFLFILGLIIGFALNRARIKRVLAKPLAALNHEFSSARTRSIARQIERSI